MYGWKILSSDVPTPTPLANWYARYIYQLACFAENQIKYGEA